MPVLPFSWFQASTQTDPALSRRALDIIEYWAKVAGALTIVGGFIGVVVAKVVKPYNAWRRRQLAAIMRDVLKDELGRLDAVTSREDEVFRLLGMIYARQSELFQDVDAFLEIAATNTERLDEMNDLLDASGFSSDRRRTVAEMDGERARVVELFTGLNDRRRGRRRFLNDDAATRERFRQLELERATRHEAAGRDDPREPRFHTGAED